MSKLIAVLLVCSSLFGLSFICPTYLCILGIWNKCSVERKTFWRFVEILKHVKQRVLCVNVKLFLDEYLYLSFWPYQHLKLYQLVHYLSLTYIASLNNIARSALHWATNIGRPVQDSPKCPSCYLHSFKFFSFLSCQPNLKTSWRLNFTASRKKRLQYQQYPSFVVTSC